MQWPVGSYALLTPTSGCPNDVQGTWQKTSRSRGTGNRFSYTSSDSGLNTTLLTERYKEKLNTHEFCVHGTSRGGAGLQEYKSFWGPGSYCILRHAGACPRGLFALLKATIFLKRLHFIFSLAADTVF